MRAHACLVAAADQHRPAGAAGTRIERLRSDAPLVLRPTVRPAVDCMGRWDMGAAAHVSLASAAAGPIGGDHFRLDVEVAAGAVLVVRSVSAALVLPGPHGLPSHTEANLRVAAGGSLVWLPGAVIAARRCDHRATTRIELEPGARLLAREELLLGRHGETPGTIRQRLRITRAGRPLYDQEVAVGRHAPGWGGPAVTGGRRALGTLLAVDPDGTTGEDAAREEGSGADLAVMPLDESAVLVTALCDDTLALRRLLDERVASLGATGPAPPR